ncbi:MAG: UDP-N-acetylmuramate dehydrogenase [Lachnospiraceae bacterium]|jgi:UDP-N-acetylmuramate dehydrogenase|nr:UDP-N-acetylmuramate dehydrogenase [Lachnospiraceae bacterium]
MPDLEIRKHEQMSKHTTFRIGGPADLYITPKANQVADIVKLCRQTGVPFFVFGNGSNLLVSDKGIRGVVIEIGKNMKQVTVEDTVIKAQAGATLGMIAGEAAKAGLTGMEFASGIPGCLGGALVMNAGAYGGEMKQIVTEVECLTEDGERITLSGEEMEFGYRTSLLSKKPYIAMSATMKLTPGKEEEIRQRMQELNAQRLSKQPLEYPSAGSTFKRPEGYFAGKLIMDAGLAGYHVGDARVSEKHCGFVINTGNATAADVRQLMTDVDRIVKEKFGVGLEPEVKFIGEF